MCDGVDDCNSGEDETGCRKIASLFAKEEGFRLQGRASEKEGSLQTFQSYFPGSRTNPTKEETFEASEEECAKECYYSKR